MNKSNMLHWSPMWVFPQQDVPAAVDNRVYAAIGTTIGKNPSRKKHGLYHKLKKLSYRSVTTLGILVILAWFFSTTPNNIIEEPTPLLVQTWAIDVASSWGGQNYIKLVSTQWGTATYDTSDIDSTLEEIDTVLAFLNNDSEWEFDTL